MTKLFVVFAALCASALTYARPVALTATWRTPAPENFSITRVAVEGDWMVATGLHVDVFNVGAAFLYRRAGISAPWVFQRKLLEAPHPQFETIDLPVAMESNLLAIQIDGSLRVFERSGAVWTQATVLANPGEIAGGVIQIDGQQILVGTGNCGNAAVFEKRVDGRWAISGRLSGAPGDCDEYGITDHFDVSGGYGIVAVRSGGDDDEPRAFRRVAGQSEWMPVASLPAQIYQYRLTPMALRGSLALLSGDVTEGTRIFRRSDASGVTWNQLGNIRPLDLFTGTGHAINLRQRGDLVLINNTVFRQRPDSSFEHVATLDDTPFNGADLYTRTAVLPRGDAIFTYILPQDLSTPAPLRDDFEGGGEITWTTSGSASFSVVGASNTHVYRQANTSGEAVAQIAGSDWANHSIEATIRPIAFASAGTSWFGPFARRQPNGDQYLVRLQADGGLYLRKRVNGVESQVSNGGLVPVAAGTPLRVRLETRGNILQVFVNDERKIYITENSLTRGTAGFATFRTRADIDNVVLSPIATTIFRTYPNFGLLGDFTVSGGSWSEVDASGVIERRQSAPTGSALSLTGVATDDQVIRARLRMGPVTTGSFGWAGVVARYMDDRNFYAATLSSANRLQIRKVVNGTATILRSVPFTVTSGREYQLRFEALGSRLHAFVDGVFLAEVGDASLASGRLGIGTLNAPAAFLSLDAYQP